MWLHGNLFIMHLNSLMLLQPDNVIQSDRLGSEVSQDARGLKDFQFQANKYTKSNHNLYHSD